MRFEEAVDAMVGQAVRRLWQDETDRGGATRYTVVVTGAADGLEPCICISTCFVPASCDMHACGFIHTRATHVVVAWT